LRTSYYFSCLPAGGIYTSPVMKKHPSGSQARKRRKALEQITNQSQIKRFLVGTSHPTCSNSISRNDTSPKHSNNTSTGKYAWN